jgi:selenocysteine lyase/cysteine desulfurase
MGINRRDALKSIGGIAAAAALNQPLPSTAAVAEQSQAPVFPRKQDFDIADGYTYINAAFTHPMPRVSMQAVQRHAENRNRLGAAAGQGGGERADPKTLFAELINAKPTEIAYVPNTSTGENLVVNALGLDRKFDGNVVTDWLHYDGALVHLLELEKLGLDVRIVKPTKEFRIDIKDMEKVVNRNTKLIQVSSIAMYNGFEHDLKAVCDLAHSVGAYVYADIIHSAGAVPFDVKASGVDFAACSSFKWLMGDFGLGFIYAREDVLPKIGRSQIGYQQLSRMQGHFPPFDPEAENKPVTWEFRPDAKGYFEVGTFGGSIAAGLGTSLQYIKGLGVANIQAARVPLLKQLREEVPKLKHGFVLVTPPESTAGVITFAKKDVGRGDLPAKLQAARVNVRFSLHWMRLSPSVYNDTKDIDRFLEALA